MRSSILFALSFCGLLFNSLTVTAFFPNNIYGCLSSKSANIDHTHSSITEVAVNRVINKFSSLNLIPPGNWNESRRKALAAILEGSNEIGRLKDDKAAHHFNADRFVEGNNLLVEWRKQILELAKQNQSQNSLRLMRHLIGQSLHLIQDFYSNSDWVQFNLEINRNLSMENRQPLLVPERPCKEVNPDAKQFKSIKHGRRDGYASGYRSGQDIEKPADYIVDKEGEVVGKCSHGGSFDSSVVIDPTGGGLNSESYDKKLSPRKAYHFFSANASFDATEGFFIHNTDYGLSSELPSEMLLSILGVGSKQHISLLQTSSLRKMAESAEWLTSWASYGAAGSAWPWHVSHLFTADGDVHMVNKNTSIYKQMKNSAEDASLAVTETNILRASQSLPDGSHLMIVTNNAQETPDLSWNEELIKKILIERNIRLWWFVEGSTLPGKDELELMQNTCLATRGMMFFIRDSRDLLDILFSIKPDMHLTHYTVSDEVNILLEGGKHTFLLTNCERPQTKWPMVSSVSGEMFTSEVVTTEYVSVYRIQLYGSKSQLAMARLENSHVKYCTVSVWTEMSLVRVYPVARGPRDQWYSTKGHACIGCKVAIETSAPFTGKLKPQKLLFAQEALALRHCRHDTSRAELRRTSISDSVTESQLQSNHMQVKLEYSKTTPLSITEYITTRHVDINAQYTLLDSTSAIDIVILSVRSGDADLEFTMTEERVNISPSHHKLSADGNCTIQLTFPSGLLQEMLTKLMTFIVKGVDGSNGQQFYDTHTFQIISLLRPKSSNKTKELDTLSSTTVSTHFSISNTSSLLNVSTVDSRTANSSGTDTITPIVEKVNVTAYFFVALVGTIVCISTLMVLAAAAIYVYNHYYRKGRPYKSDHKPIPVTEL